MNINQATQATIAMIEEEILVEKKAFKLQMAMIDHHNSKAKSHESVIKYLEGLKSKLEALKPEGQEGVVGSNE